MGKLELSDNIVSLLNILITALIAVVTSVITSKYSGKAEKQNTSRMIFEKCYTKIYSLVEYDLFSKKVTLEKVKHYGNEIIKICDNADNYFFPSVKVHAENLRDSNEDNYQERWEYFSERFSMRYDIICKDIGVPLRNQAYRINRGHYKNNWHFFRLYLLNDWTQFLFFLVLLLLLFLHNLNFYKL